MLQQPQIEACNFIKKEALAQMFPSESSVNTFLNFCEISKNTFLHRTALVPTSTYCNFKRALATYI